jgi:hypothetical protein
MPVHIFVTSEENHKICIQKGLAAVPSKASSPNINDALISRMALIGKGDLILFYITGKKELTGVYQAVDKPFYDDTLIWNPPQKDESQNYPFRVKLENTEFRFNKRIGLSDVYDLQDSGKIWTFSLNRPSGTANSMFAITHQEYKHILELFIKVNPIYTAPKQIREPYRYIEPNLRRQLTLLEDGQPKYEYTLMALLLDAFTDGKYEDIFGPYSDCVAYVPTSFNKEIDILLTHSNPIDKDRISAFTIIEVKNKVFDEGGLQQLLQYEDWFLKKRVNGDRSMIRTVAIAKQYSSPVIDYLEKRVKYEGKEILLLTYENNENGLKLRSISS